MYYIFDAHKSGNYPTGALKKGERRRINRDWRYAMWSSSVLNILIYNIYA